MTTRPVRVLLVDDHEVVRDGLRALLDGGGDDDDAWAIVGEAATAADAVRLAEEAAPDLIVLDVHLPDGSGIDACRAIRDLGVPARVLMLSGDGDDDTVLAAVAAGADAYVLKHIDSERLLDAIGRCAAGEPLLDARARDRAHERAPTLDPGDVGALSHQEQRVLELVAAGLTNREIGRKLTLSEKTVKNYVSNVLAKLGVARRSEAAVRLAVLQARDTDRRRTPTGDPIRW